MKVLLDIDSTLQPLTGIGWYTRLLAQHLGEFEDKLELRFMSRHGIDDCLPEQPDTVTPSGPPATEQPLRRLRRPRLKIPIVSNWSRYRRRRAQQRKLKPYRGWLFHGTNFTVPDFDGPAVATFHDMTVLTHPQFHPAVRVSHMSQNIEHAAGRCRRLITVSEFSRGEICRQLGIARDNIHVTPLAPRPGFRPRKADETTPVLDRLGLRHGSYILFCGTVEPRKNIPVLLRAFAGLPDQVRRRWPLVIAGGAGWNSGDIHHEIKQAERHGQVRYTGYVDDATLRLLFSGAAVFVLPSVTEGFGLPVIEAMASGVPVLCSTGGSLPEVAGDLSACFNPEEDTVLRDKLVEVIEDSKLRSSMISHGLTKSACHTWRLVAEQTMRCYEDALEQ